MAEKCVQPEFINPDLVTKLVSGNTMFTADLYQELSKGGSANLFFSPVSISLALAMAYVGASDNTAAEMKQTLRLTELGDEEINYAYKDMNQVLQSGNGKAYTLKTANRIFARQNYKFLQEFLDVTRKFYSAEAETLDFAGDTDGSRTAINKWVEEQTANKIKDLLADGAVSSDTAMVLVNAIYFKGDWAEKFYSSATREEKFKLASGNTVNAQTMHMQKKMRYGQNKALDCKIVELPYIEEELSMFIVLPNNDDGLSDLEKVLTAENLQKLMSGMRKVEVVLTLPKFKLEHQFSVKDTLMTLGMKDIFSMEKANFSGMDGTRLLYASDVIHKAFIEVNEEGSEAAAATGVVMMMRCMPITMDFKADHPFVFIIRENRSNGILFMGRVADPS